MSQTLLAASVTIAADTVLGITAENADLVIGIPIAPGGNQILYHRLGPATETVLDRLQYALDALRQIEVKPSAMTAAQPKGG